MSTATTAGTGKATRAASQRVIVWLRATMRKALEPFGCDGLVQTVRGSGYRFSTRAA